MYLRYCIEVENMASAFIVFTFSNAVILTINRGVFMDVNLPIGIE